MKIVQISLLALSLIISSNAYSAFLGRDLDGDLSTIEAYYVEGNDITLLADANYSMTSGYDDDGRMDWYNANFWAETLTINGYGGWRLPTTNDWCEGPGGCGNELWPVYATLVEADTSDNYLSEEGTSPFTNLYIDSYWSDTLATGGDGGQPIFYSAAFSLDMYYGIQSLTGTDVELYAWAMQSGDIGVAVSSVPVPASIWLFGSGLPVVLLIAGRRKDTELKSSALKQHII